MKNRIFIAVIFFFVGLASCKHEKFEQNISKISGDFSDSLYSKILQEKREIIVYLPSSYSYSNQSFPVIYLIDGEIYQSSVINILQQLSEANMNMVVPQMIVVGIVNTDRTRDLTPTHISTDKYVKDSNYYKTSGGSEKFSSFIEKELIPYIDLKYRTTPYRVLIGHSFGGLFCVNTLLNKTNLFRGYIAIDPSLFWDDQLMLKQADQKLDQKNFAGTSFYLSVANSEYSDNDTFKNNKESIELAKYIELNKSNSLNFGWKYYADDNHYTVPLISLYDGLRFIFDFYNPRLPFASFREPDFKADSFIITHFKKVSSCMGYQVFPPESIINWFGYLFILEKQYQKAYSFFKLNIEYYPNSFNVYDSMGEVLMLMGKTNESIQYYEKSLLLNPDNENAKKMIAKMKR